MLALMLDGNDLSGLLDEKFNPAIWNLLWLLAAPAFWIIHRWYTLYLADREVAEDQATALAASARALAGLEHRDMPVAGPTPERIAAIWRRYPGRWAIAGGWAVDLHLGRATRAHDDIEVAVLRTERKLLWDYLLGWQPQYVQPDSGARLPWLRLKQLDPPVHELHCDPPQWDVADLEVLLDDAAGREWVYRRDARIRLPLARAILQTATGIPYLAPEIVLLYKSKQPRPCDEQDFAAALPSLDAEQRQWLRAALEMISPQHPWIARVVSLA